MELLFAIGIIAAIAAAYFIWKNKIFDANKDGKVDKEDVKPIVEKVEEVVKEAADVNNDGKVNVEDVKTVAKKAKETVKKVAAKKPATKTPAAKTPAAKTPAKPRKPKISVAK